MGAVILEMGRSTTAIPLGFKQRNGIFRKNRRFGNVSPDKVTTDVEFIRVAESFW